MIRRLQKVTSVTAILLYLLIMTGSLISCGPVSFEDGKVQGGENAAEYEQSIEVESSEEIPIYYAGENAAEYEHPIEVGSNVKIPIYYAGEEEVTYQADEITSYAVNVSSNDEASGTVKYKIGYTDGRQTVTATATPAEGYVLDSWMVNGESATELGDNESVSITDISGDINLGAVFVDPESGLSQDQRLLSMTPSLRTSALLGAASTDTSLPKPGDIETKDLPALPTPSGNYRGGAFYRLFTYIAPGVDPAWGRVTGGFIGNDKTPVTINATANSGYEFDRWRIIEAETEAGENDGKVYKKVIRDYEKTGASSLTLNFETTSTDSKTIYVTWCFAYFKPKGAYTVKVVNDSASGGTSTIQEQDGSGTDLGSAVSGQAEITSGNTAVITATPATGYKFDCFVTQDGTRVSGTANGAGGYTLTLKDVHQDITITAKYKSTSKVNVTVQASPEKGGKVKYNSNSAVSSGTYEYNPSSESAFTLTAIPAMGYKFLNWEDSTGNVFNSKEIGISGLSEDRTYTAIFVSESSDEDVMVTIQPSPEKGGKVKYNSEEAVSSQKTYTYRPSTEPSFTLVAIPATGYKFLYWEDSVGNVFNSKEIGISGLSEHRTYTAIFVSESSDEEAKGLRVVAEPASGGHVRKKASATAGMVDITAYPNRGWNFVGWKKDGGTIFSKSKKATVADESVTYVGVFEKDENYKATTDLVDEHFYNDKRSFTEPNYTVTKQTMENLAAVSVSYDKLRNANDLPALHSYGAVASVSDYFDRKLSASDVTLAEGILTTTNGEVIPIEKIKDIDALMNSAKSISLDKFGERYDSEIVAAIYTEPPGEFDGLVRTYLWKETGAQKGDNIYVMYRDKGSSYQEMAAVVDDDGTVRFTLEDVLIGTEFVLVRVNIESKHLPS